MSAASSCRELNLLELILRGRWSAVERRVRSCPVDLLLEKDGLTSLHWLCCNDPPARVLREALLHDTYNVACTKEFRHEGATPLLLYLSVCTDEAINVECVEVFCKHAPGCIRITDTFRRSALHLVCCRGVERQPRSNVQVVKLLLQVAPELSLFRNSDGDTALDRLWRSCGYVDGDADSAIGGYLWTVVELICSAAVPSSKGSLLHRLVTYPYCCPDLLDYAIDWNPQLLLQVDDEGNTALHRCLLVCQNQPHQEYWKESKAKGGVDTSALFPTKRDPSPVVEVLVRRCPQLVQIRNKEGLLPFQISMSMPWMEYHEILVRHHPAGLVVCDLPELYYPSLLAQVTEVDTIHRILRAKPNLFCSAAKHGDWLP